MVFRFLAGGHGEDATLELERERDNHSDKIGKTGVTADRDKIEFWLFNSSSIFNITLREELFSLPKQKQTMHSYPGFMALVT